MRSAHDHSLAEEQLDLRNIVASTQRKAGGCQLMLKWADEHSITCSGNIPCSAAMLS